MRVLLKLFRGNCFPNVSDRYEVDRRLYAGHRAKLTSDHLKKRTLLAPSNDFMRPGSAVGIKKFGGRYESTINVTDALNVVLLPWKTMPILTKIDSGTVLGIGYGKLNAEAKRGLMMTNG